MSDVRVVGLAARQHNRFSRAQVLASGLSADDIDRRVACGRWVTIHQGVYAIAPALDSDEARWTAAVLTDPGSVLSHASAGAVWGWWDRARSCEVVTRPGSGGPELLDGIVIHRSTALDGETTVVLGLPVTGVPRTLLDLSPHIGLGALARATREALRLQTTTVPEVVEALATRHRGRRGARRLAAVLARYSGLPVERCRSAAEVRALEVLREAGRPSPEVNRRIAGEEADLSWRAHRLIVEIDGGRFHLDAGEDARKQAIWERAGWEVRRIGTAGVFDVPERLLALAPHAERR